MSGDPPGDAVVVRVVPGPVGEAALQRAIGAMAARCDLPVDRLQDAILAGTVLLGGATADDVPLEVCLSARRHALGITAGPYAPGEAQRVVGAEAQTGVTLLSVLSAPPSVRAGRHGGDLVSLLVAAVPQAPWN